MILLPHFISASFGTLCTVMCVASVTARSIITAASNGNVIYLIRRPLKLFGSTAAAGDITPYRSAVLTSSRPVASCTPLARSATFTTPS